MSFRSKLEQPTPAVTACAASCTTLQTWAASLHPGMA